MAMKIARVEPGSEAEGLGLGPGDELLSVDENELNDSLDYDFYTDSKSFHLKARVADGIREWDVQRTEHVEEKDSNSSGGSSTHTSSSGTTHGGGGGSF